MLATLLALTLASGASAVAPPVVTTVDDVVARVGEGIPSAAIVAAIVGSGVYLSIDAEQAVRLYFEGVPAPVLEAIFASSGEDHPEVSARPGEIELLYDGFRILGRKARDGATAISVSGYDRKGKRLSPPVAAPARIAEAETRSHETMIERESEPGSPVVIQMPAPSAATVSITIAQEPRVSYQEPAVVYLASPYGYGYGNSYSPRIDAGLDLRPTVGFDWANYSSLAWPAFRPRAEWSNGVIYGAPPLAPAPGPRVVRDTISR